MADGYIQVPTDAGGKKVDVEELTRPDGSVVERQRVKIPDPVWIDGDVARLMLAECQLQSFLLARILEALTPGSTIELSQIRNDITGPTGPLGDAS
jgi:hypothetical protein